MTPDIWNVRTWCFYAETLHDPQSAELPCSHCCYLTERGAEKQVSITKNVCLGGGKWRGGEEPERHPGNDGKGPWKDLLKSLLQAPRTHKNWVKHHSSSGLQKPHFLVSRMNLFCLMFGTSGSEEGEVLIITWESEFCGLNALREGSLLFFESDF